MHASPNFDHIARPYRWLEYITFGRLLEHCRFSQLPHLTTARNALILGDGDGRFLSRLLQQNPALQATAVDLSPAMLHLLQHRCSLAQKKSGADISQRLTLIQSDIRTFSPPAAQHYDLIVTHFFLDCLTENEISTLLSRLQPSLQPNTQWLLSEFALPANRLLRPPARLLIRALYAAFHLLTGLKTSRLPDHRRALRANHWVCVEHRTFAAGLLVSEFWKFTQPKQ